MSRGQARLRCGLGLGDTAVRVWLGRAVGAVTIILAGTAQAQPRPSVVTNPDWLERPSAELLAEVYPPLAQELGLPGRAVISCLVDATGRLRHCLVVDQFPAGLGFGAATLKAADSFRMSPKTVDGQPVPGGTVRIPLRYTLPEQAHSDLPETKKPTSAAVGALTPRFSVAIAAELTAQYAERALALETAPQTEVDEATRAAAQKALIAAAAKFIPAWSLAIAEQHAAIASDAQMEMLTAFRASPDGMALSRGYGDVHKAYEESFAEHFRRVGVTARTTFCAKDRCRIGVVEPASGVGILSPRWLETPSQEARIEGRPALAQAFNIGGWARLNCIVSKEATPTFCVTTTDSPSGFGFGEAASKLSTSYKLHPDLMTAGAQGETVSLLVEFPAAEAATHPAKAPPDTARMALARQLVAADRDVEKVAAGVAGLDQQIAALMADRNDQAAASSALRGALIEEMPRLSEAMAAAHARQFTEAQLKLALAYKAGPPIDFSADFHERQNNINAHYAELVRAEARRAFCETRRCFPPPKP